MCIIPGIPGSNEFSINFCRNQRVDKLKDEIKKKNLQLLSSVDANLLKLYKICIDLSNIDKYMEIMDDMVQPDYVFNPKLELLPPCKISMYFEQGKEEVI